MAQVQFIPTGTSNYSPMRYAQMESDILEGVKQGTQKGVTDVTNALTQQIGSQVQAKKNRQKANELYEFTINVFNKAAMTIPGLKDKMGQIGFSIEAIPKPPANDAELPTYLNDMNQKSSSVADVLHKEYGLSIPELTTWNKNYDASKWGADQKAFENKQLISKLIAENPNLTKQELLRKAGELPASELAGTSAFQGAKPELTDQQKLDLQNESEKKTLTNKLLSAQIDATTALGTQRLNSGSNKPKPDPKIEAIKHFQRVYATTSDEKMKQKYAIATNAIESGMAQNIDDAGNIATNIIKSRKAIEAQLNNDFANWVGTKTKPKTVQEVQEKIKQALIKSGTSEADAQAEIDRGDFKVDMRKKKIMVMWEPDVDTAMNESASRVISSESMNATSTQSSEEEVRQAYESARTTNTSLPPWDSLTQEQKNKAISDYTSANSNNADQE